MNKGTEIIFYDFENVEISRISFYLNGFILNQKKYAYRFIVKRLVPSILAGKSMEGDWRKYLFDIGLFEVRKNGSSFFFCIDRSDHSTNYMSEGFHIPLLEVVKYYFKVNYNKEAVYADPYLSGFREKIIPTGPSFPIRTMNNLSFLCRAISYKRPDWTPKLVKDRLKLMTRMPTINHFRNLRRVQSDLDVFFIMRYYDNPNQQQQNDFRYEVMRELGRHRHRNIVTGFVSRRKLPGKFARLTKQPYEMNAYLHHLACSKVAVYVRGPHHGISSKLGQYLAMGKPIIGESILNNKELFYDNHYFNEQFVYDTPMEISDHVESLLRDPQKLTFLGEANAKTFDTHFTPEITTVNIIKTLLHCR